MVSITPAASLPLLKDWAVCVQPSTIINGIVYVRMPAVLFGVHPVFSIPWVTMLINIPVYAHHFVEVFSVSQSEGKYATSHLYFPKPLLSIIVVHSS